MSFLDWPKSSVDYGRKLVASAIEGARTGENEFFKDEPSAPYFSESARRAVGPAVIGACVGAAAGCLGNGRSKGRALTCALLGGFLGFGAGVLWESRKFTVSVASAAWKGVSKTRDEHWFERNPIDYA